MDISEKLFQQFKENSSLDYRNNPEIWSCVIASLFVRKFTICIELQKKCTTKIFSIIFWEFVFHAWQNCTSTVYLWEDRVKTQTYVQKAWFITLGCVQNSVKFLCCCFLRHVHVQSSQCVLWFLFFFCFFFQQIKVIASIQ